MKSYNQRLQFAIGRRDRALVKMHHAGIAGSAVVFDRLEQVGRAVRAEIGSGKVFIGEQVEATGNILHREIDHLGLAAHSQIEALKTRLNPAKFIAKHPWGTMFCGVLSGVLALPLVKALYARRSVEGPLAEASYSNGDAAKNGSEREPWWKPLADLLLERMTVLATTVIKRGGQPSATQQPSCGPGSYTAGQDREMHGR